MVSWHLATGLGRQLSCEEMRNDCDQGLTFITLYQKLEIPGYSDKGIEVTFSLTGKLFFLEILKD